ncbi:unnamed protein product, partial [marine sediment metagenome]
GDSAKIWHLDADAHRVYELSVSDFSVVRQAAATGRSDGVQGIGGKTAVIWYCAENESYVSKLHELSTSDFSSVRSTDAPTNWSSGVGGDIDTIWYTQFGTDLAYELDETEPPPQPPSAPTNLLCNGQTNPVDIIAEDFQAIYNDPNAGDIAQHYRLQVNTKSDFTGRMMWDSGKTPMADTPEGTYCPLIYYNGQALSLNKIQYFWRIKFWDDEDQEGAWSAAANFTLAGCGAGEAGALPWEQIVLEPSGEAKVEIPRRSGQWTTLEDLMRIHTSSNKNPLDAVELAQAELTVSNISKNFNSFEEASTWYKQLEGYALQLSLGCKIAG